MSDKKVKHFVFIHFFPFQHPRYPHNIFDVDFLSKQLFIAKNNALKSLENQTNKDFTIIFTLNLKYFSDPKYEFIFTELKNATSLPLKLIKNIDSHYFAFNTLKQLSLIKEAWDDYDFVIQSRMDFDDFIYKDAIADTQAKVTECKNILAYGYCRGYSYLTSNNELYPYLQTWKGTGHPGILQSLILESSFAKKIPFIGVFDFNHTKVKIFLQEFLKENGIEFSKNMFQQNTTTNAMIYFRHEFSHSILTRDGKNGYLPRNSMKEPFDKLTTKDITKEQLRLEFGFDGYKLNSIE